jgi:hypothetical protein
MANGIDLLFDRSSEKCHPFLLELQGTDFIIYAFDCENVTEINLYESSQSIQEHEMKILTIHKLPNVIKIADQKVINNCVKFPIPFKSNKYWLLEFKADNKYYSTYVDFVHQIARTIFVFTDKIKNFQTYMHGRSIWDIAVIMLHMPPEIIDYFKYSYCFIYSEKLFNIAPKKLNTTSTAEHRYINYKFHQNINRLIESDYNLEVPTYRYLRFKHKNLAEYPEFDNIDAKINYWQNKFMINTKYLDALGAVNELIEKSKLNDAKQLLHNTIISYKMQILALREQSFMKEIKNLDLTLEVILAAPTLYCLVGLTIPREWIIAKIKTYDWKCSNYARDLAVIHPKSGIIKILMELPNFMCPIIPEIINLLHDDVYVSNWLLRIVPSEEISQIINFWNESIHMTSYELVLPLMKIYFKRLLPLDKIIKNLNVISCHKLISECVADVLATNKDIIPLILTELISEKEHKSMINKIIRKNLKMTLKSRDDLYSDSVLRFMEWHSIDPNNCPDCYDAIKYEYQLIDPLTSPVSENEKYMRNISNISQIMRHLELSCQCIIDANSFISKAHEELLEMEKATVRYGLDIDIITIKNAWEQLTIPYINQLMYVE